MKQNFKEQDQNIPDITQDVKDLKNKEVTIEQTFDMFEKIEAEYNTVTPPCILYRYNRGGDRYYYTNPESPDGMISYTTLAGYEVGMSYAERLMKWRAEVGEEAAQYIMKSTAAQGTGEHILIGLFSRGELNSFAEVKDFGFDWALSQGYPHLAAEWMDYYCESIASWMAFVKEKNVEVLAVEFPLFDEEWGIAGLVDIVAEMDFNRKRRKCIIDIKRNARSGEMKYAFQLQAQKEVWNKKYPDIFEIEGIFNWSSKNWTRTKGRNPSYDLVNRTVNKFSSTMSSRLSYIRQEGIISPPITHLLFRGEFSLEGLSEIDLSQIIL